MVFIETNSYFSTGSGGIDSSRMKINTDEISSITECGLDHRPYHGKTLVVMKNGNKFYTSIKLEDLDSTTRR